MGEWEREKINNNSEIAGNNSKKKFVRYPSFCGKQIIRNFCLQQQRRWTIPTAIECVFFSLFLLLFTVEKGKEETNYEHNKTHLFVTQFAKKINPAYSNLDYRQKWLPETRPFGLDFGQNSLCRCRAFCKWEFSEVTKEEKWLHQIRRVSCT